MAGVKSTKSGASIVRHRYLDGKQVKPVKYVGVYGRYMAGAADGEFNLVLDPEGKPLEFRKIGILGNILKKK